MPYINKHAKRHLDAGGKPLTPGELTYLFQQAMKHFLESKRQSYSAYAECLGALEGAKADLIDRKLLPYEQRKRKENGDVWND